MAVIQLLWGPPWEREYGKGGGREGGVVTVQTHRQLSFSTRLCLSAPSCFPAYLSVTSTGTEKATNTHTCTLTSTDWTLQLFKAERLTEQHGVMTQTHSSCALSEYKQTSMLSNAPPEVWSFCTRTHTHTSSQKSIGTA